MSARNRPAAPTGRRSARYAHLLKVCRGRGCSREDARDVVQEAHARLFEYQRVAKLRDADSILRRIVINLSINHYHSEQSRPLAFESIEQLDRRGVLIDPTAGPERTLAAEQELDQVWARLLRAVGLRACQIFVMQRIGYSYEEIAIAVAIKPRTVERHVWVTTSVLTDE